MSTDSDLVKFNHFAMAHMGTIYNRFGPLGTGVFVETADGIALLTAKHVALPALLFGPPSIGDCISGQESFPVGYIRIASDVDAALMYFDPEHHTTGALTSAAVQAAMEESVSIGDEIVCCGLPREMAKNIDSTNKKVESSVALQVFSEIRSVTTGSLECTPPMDKRLPPTYGGMSGGPAFTSDGRLLGIVQAEVRKGADPVHTIRVTPAPRLRQLFFPSLPPGNWQTDYWQQSVGMNFDLRLVIGKKLEILPGTVEFRLIHSPSDPYSENGTFAEIRKLHLPMEGRTELYEVGTRSYVPVDPGNSNAVPSLIYGEIDALLGRPTLKKSDFELLSARESNSLRPRTPAED